MNPKDITLHQVDSQSGNIVAAGYDAESQYLVVEFKGGRKYGYKEVPADAWESFKATFDSSETSTGSHFHNNIRNAYPSEEI